MMRAIVLVDHMVHDGKRVAAGAELDLDADAYAALHAIGAVALAQDGEDAPGEPGVDDALGEPGAQPAPIKPGKKGAAE